ncbi:squalene epoxidase [Chaetomium sp. MPI-CAGE-AT-0009]|nr:squalene epoxidase [Chaetomium sp. MPI-CAGE-AT-0009]
MTTVADVLVIGAGIAGCGIAAAFARQGRNVVVVERSLREPDRIVGELLQPGGVAALTKLGLAHCLEDIEATPVEGYHLFWKNEEATFWYCPVSTNNEPVITPTGRSFHHGRFVAKLRDAVAGYPNITLLEATALELLRDETTGAVVGAVCSRNGASPKEHRAHLTILADGASSKFRSQFTRHRPKAQSRFWGLEMADAHLPRHRYAYGVLGKGPPILIYQIGARETRILVDIPDTIHRQLGSTESVKSYFRQRIVPIVPLSIRSSLKRAVEQGRLRSMPNAWMPSTRNTTPGLIMLGDSANMRHPVTGAGMTVALKDAVLLADLLDPPSIPSLEDADSVSKKLRQFHWRRKSYSAALNILAQALCFLFVSQDHALGIMQRGFVRYVQEGEKNFAVPAWLMGGVVESPFLLFRYFFRIAIYSISLHLQCSGWLGLPGAMLESVLVFISAVKIIWEPIVDELRL